jgi:hypothetical protein
MPGGTWPFRSRTLSPADTISVFMLDVNAYNSHVAARLTDFFSAGTQWHRRLWCVGVSLMLSEILEGSEGVRDGVLSAESLKVLATAVMFTAGPDPGAGSGQQKQLLQQALKSDLKFQGLDYYTVRDIRTSIRETYLKRWAEALAGPQPLPQPERVARSIASHLLDLGFSSDYLHRWWTYKSKYEPGTRTLAEVISDAHQLAVRPRNKYSTLVAFEEIPKTKSVPARWMDATSVSNWLTKCGFENRDVRQKGGILITGEATDAAAAVELAQETIEKLASRAAVGVSGRLRASSLAWVAGQKTPFKLGQRRRAVQIYTLHREDQIYSDAAPSKVDAAIELLAPLTSSSPGTAVAGGWAAIEALLSDPNDRGTAAERMAALVACSMPRAELTPLSYAVEKGGGSIADRLKTITENRDRCELLATGILDKSPLSVSEPSDVAALSRLERLLSAPDTRLKDLQSHLEIAFRRLYRQRNLVLHGGRTNAIALRSCTRTIAPLVGAGMDRIAHGWFVEGIEPLELAARARIRLALLGPQDGVKSVDLLS